MGPVYDPGQEALVLLGYLIANTHVVGIDDAGRAVLEVELGPAVLDQLAAFGSHDEDLEDGDEDDDADGAPGAGLQRRRGGVRRAGRGTWQGEFIAPWERRR